MPLESYAATSVPMTNLSCPIPFLNSFSGFTFSSSFVIFDEMFQTTQCTHVPTGASGSSLIRAKLFVPAGAFFHVNLCQILIPDDQQILRSLFFSGLRKIVTSRDYRFPVNDHDLVAGYGVSVTSERSEKSIEDNRCTGEL